MSDTTTVHYGWTMPEVGASPDTWGNKLNNTIGATSGVLGIDAVVRAVQTTADLALPATSYTAPDILTKLLGVDGAGSLLDADKVDGLQATQLGRLASVSDFTGAAYGNGLSVRGNDVGYLQMPLAASAATAARAAAGGCYDQTGATITIPADIFFAGDVLCVYNNTAGTISIAQGASLTMRLAGSATTGSRTLSPRGIASLLFRGATGAGGASREVIVNGNVS